jgi:hypothetical protein
VTSSWGLTSSYADEGSILLSKNDFRYLLRYHPLQLDGLLGKHLTSVVPGETWGGLYVPEEYRNPAIRYAVFARGEVLKAYMKDWTFIKQEYCISDYSMFLLFFNRGYVFKIELRYIPDTFTGTIKPGEKSFCGDETPIFEILSKQLGGSITFNNGQRELVHAERTYTLIMTTSGGATVIYWKLKGGPCTVPSCPDE